MTHPGSQAYDAQVVSRTIVAALAFIVYDMVLHLADEVELVWRGPMSWVKVVYPVVRHLPYLVHGASVALIGDIKWTHSQCRVWLIFQNVAVEVIMIAVEIILVLRVWAMYNCNPVVLAVLTALLFAELGAICAVLSMTLPYFQTETNGCLVTVTPKLFPYMWLIPLAFETTLFVLTLVKFVKSIALQRYMGGSRSIMFILMRDGTWAYALIFVIMLLNTVFYTVEHNLLSGLFFVWQITLLSYAGSHLLLNMRRLSVTRDVASQWTNNLSSVVRFESKPTGRTDDSHNTNGETLEHSSLPHIQHSVDSLESSSGEHRIA